MWMDIGWGLYFQVVQTHKHYISSLKFFLPLVVGALKCITFVSLPSLPLAPSHSPLTPLTPSCSPHSLPLPLLPLRPTHSPHSLSPLAPTDWWGSQNSITNIGHWEWEEVRGEWEGASWEGPLAQQSWWESQNLPPQVVGTPKHTPRSPLCPTSAQSIMSKRSKLGVRGGTLGSREVVGTPKIGPTGGRDPKTYHLMSITHYLCLVHWEWGERVGSEMSKPWPNRGCQHPKTCPHR